MKEKSYYYILILFSICWIIATSSIVASWHPELRGGPIPPETVRLQATLELFGIGLLPLMIIGFILISIANKHGSPVTDKKVNNDSLS